MAEQLYNFIGAEIKVKNGPSISGLLVMEIGIENINLKHGDVSSQVDVGRIVGAISSSDSKFYIKWKPNGVQTAKIELLKTGASLMLTLNFCLRKSYGSSGGFDEVFREDMKIPEVKLTSVANSDGFEKIEVVSDAKQRKDIEIKEH